MKIPFEVDEWVKIEKMSSIVSIQPNLWTENGIKFFGEYRLLFQAQSALTKGLIEKNVFQKVELLVNRFPQLIPVQPASLIQGDLWSGNIITGSYGDLFSLILPHITVGRRQN